MKRIAFYGKSGIGKSTVCANIAAALAEQGFRVLLIGCDPKADSTRTLTGCRIPTVLQVLEENKEHRINELLFSGFKGVTCVETGIGCAGHGICSAFEELACHDIFGWRWDLVIYDVPGDDICSEFAAPMRDGYVDEVYIITSSEFMSIYEANSILRSVALFCAASSITFGAFIHNQPGVEAGRGVVTQYAARVGAHIAGKLPYANDIVRSGLAAKTVLEAYPNSTSAQIFRTMAHTVQHATKWQMPAPLEDDELEVFLNDLCYS